MKKITFALMVALCLLSACKKDKADDSARYSDKGIVTDYARADALLGKWTGPEGTFLTIERKGAEYAITIQNLDGPRTFDGKASDKGIAFQRDGVEEVIVMGDGQDTGMKWLADKVDCVVIKSGEGFCRD